MITNLVLDIGYGKRIDQNESYPLLFHIYDSSLYASKKMKHKSKK